MGRLMVITTADLAPGFQLAGVETFVAQDSAQAEAIVRELLASEEASLIAIRQDLWQTVDPGLKGLIERSYRPVVIAIPGSKFTAPEQGRRHYITELIRRVIGFQITFDTQQATSSK